MQLTRPHIPFLALYVTPPLRKWLLSLLMLILTLVLARSLADYFYYDFDIEPVFILQALLILVVGIQLLPGVFRAGELGRRSELALTLIPAREFLRFWFAPRLRRAIVLPTGWMLFMLPLRAWLQVDVREASWSGALAEMLSWAAAYFFMLFMLLAGCWLLLGIFCKVRKPEVFRLYILIAWMVMTLGIISLCRELDLEYIFSTGKIILTNPPYSGRDDKGPGVLIYGALVIAAILNYWMWRRACKVYYRLE